MACYISSRNNRFYAAVETSYGTVAAISAANRFSGISLQAVQECERPRRRDKTGSRTYLGIPGTLKARTSFALKTYLYGRESGASTPRYGALIEGAMGGSAKAINGGQAIAEVNGASLSFSQAHGLQPGDAITVGGDLRFVTSAPDAQKVSLSAPLSAAPGIGEQAGGAVVYAPAAKLPSVSLYDYWSPETAAQRLLRGSAVDMMELKVNGDFHELTFRGGAADLLDNKSMGSGAGGLTEFPAEPAAGLLMDGPIPGHLGQAWIGLGPGELQTLADAKITLRNHIDFRSKDFGSLTPRCIVTGDREVTVDLELYSRDTALFDEIYQAAKQRSPIPLMIQMGESAGSMCGVYLPSVIPAVPEFLDGEERLRWRLSGSVALGTEEDEIYVAFG